MCQERIGHRVYRARRSRHDGGGGGILLRCAQGLLLATLSMGCGHSSTPALDTGAVIFETAGGDVAFRVEVADTTASRQMGLMNRQALAADAGMLFVFSAEQILNFWMRNTFIPLDMIFIDDNRTVVGVIENATPLTDTSRSVGVPSRFVVEINANLAAQRGIVTGTHVRFEGVESPLL